MNDTALMAANETALALNPGITEKIVINGDLAGLTSPERVEYYNFICVRVGVDPATRPFEFIKLNGKLVLYARRECTDQLRRLHGVSVTDLTGSVVSNMYVVTAKVTNAKGRTDIATGAVNIRGLAGDALANAIMKTETKAKRRATLSICGLGMLDETEIDTLPDAGETHGAGGEELKRLLDGDPGAKPETAPVDEKAEARRVFMDAAQVLSGRDCNGWTLTEEQGGSIYEQAKALCGKTGAKEVAKWMREHATLGLVEQPDNGEILGVELRAKEGAVA
ncbi:MAG TPA: hypothetical protein VMY35_15155 [Phycisphaerae bacterium]|nr:hypothetical protein [Phycisphaerae bacterium]